MAGFFFDKPALRGADRSVAGCFALKQECGSIAHLGDGCVDSKVPDGRRDQILAGLEKWSQIETLVAPVDEVATSRSVAHALVVYIENEAVIGAYPNQIVGRRRWQF